MNARYLWRAAWLLVPCAALVQHFAPERAVLAFALACLSLIPLARTLGDATEHLAERLGPSLGALLNATFGNASELIIGVFAIAHGRINLVKGSLTGSILGNLLLVAGAAIVAGGVKFPRLVFSRVAAGASVSTLFLAVVALATPAMLAGTSAPLSARDVRQLSIGISLVLLVMYGLSLLFQMGTQARVREEKKRERERAGLHEQEPAPLEEREHKQTLQSVPRALFRLVGAAAFTALASEVLVSSLEGTLQSLHLPETFVGVVIVAVVGNAAEHSTALLFARRGEMDVALGIAWESSKQIALFVAPVLVFCGLAFGQPMDLVFTQFEVVSIALAVLATSLIALDGDTHWLEGAFLLAVYAVLGLGFYRMR